MDFDGDSCSFAKWNFKKIIMANKEKFIGQKIVLIITGGNVDLVSLPWQKVGKE